MVQVHLSALGEAGESHTAQADVVFKYASIKESEAAPRHVEMLQRYAGVDLAETAGEALKLERMGEKDKASRVLKQSLEAHRPYIEL